MGREICLKLGDALYNAGILGFCNVYNDFKDDWKLNGTTLTFDSDILKNFTNYYLDCLIFKYKNETVYTRIINLFEQARKEEVLLDELIKEIKDKLTKDSYLSGYEIIKSRNEEYDFEEAIKDLVSSKGKIFEEKLAKTEVFIEHMKKHKDVFILKGILYTKIQNYWGGISFLSRQKNKVEFSVAVEEDFTNSAVNFIPAEGKKVSAICSQCQVKMTKKLANTPSWIENLGIDAAKKPSNFWGYINDFLLCPICKLIYACIPLGFTMVRDEGIFINDNQNIRDLINKNSKMQHDAYNILQTTSLFGVFIDSIVNEYDKASQENQLKNIQVIRRNSAGYYSHIIPNETIKKFQICEKEFKMLQGQRIKISKTKFLNVYDETMSRVLNNKNLYSLIDLIFKFGLQDNAYINYVKGLITIQAISKIGEDKKMSESLKKYIYATRKDGESLNFLMSSDDKNSNKIKGLVFRLLNFLNSQDVHGFVDTILRQYMALGRPVPNCITEMLKDNDIFLDYGYAFVSGLSGKVTDFNPKSEDTIA